MKGLQGGYMDAFVPSDPFGHGGQVLLTLRMLQMGRQWRRQCSIALAFDDVTEGEFSPSLLPFLEQAQQKLKASKWLDGEASAAVQRRLANTARNKVGG